MTSWMACLEAWVGSCLEMILVGRLRNLAYNTVLVTIPGEELIHTLDRPFAFESLLAGVIPSKIWFRADWTH